MISLGNPSEDQPSDKEAVEQLIKDQIAAWNRGDLNAFLSGYSRSRDLTFTCGGVVQRGFDATQKRFFDAYAPPPATGAGAGAAAPADLGALELCAPLEITLLSTEAAWVLGATRLARAGDGAGGAKLTTFTLILRRTAGHGTKWEGWRIVHDHSSHHTDTAAAAAADA